MVHAHHIFDGFKGSNPFLATKIKIMKLKYSNIKTINGIDNAFSKLGLLSISDFEIFSVKKGYPVLIYNGAIRDYTGKEIENSLIQNKYNWFVKRVTMSKAAVVGRIVSEKKTTYRNSYEKNIYAAVVSDSSYAKKEMDDCALDLIDIIYPDSVKVDFMYRRKTLRSMAKSINPLDAEILMSESLNLGGDMSKIKSNVIDFMAEAGRAGYDTALFFKQGKSQHSTFGFIVDPYELVESDVVSVTTTTAKNFESEVYYDVTKFIKVQNGADKELIVPYIGLDEARRLYMLKLFQKGLLKKIKFMAMKYGGLLHYAKPI